MKRKGYLLSVLVVAIILFSVIFVMISSEDDNGITDDLEPFRGPIKIEGDVDFAKKAENRDWPGDGTADNPYVIRGYDFNVSGESGIRISSTNVHFIIKDFRITSADSPYNENEGIYLGKVSNCTIDNCTIDNFEYGLSLSFSDNNSISNNHFSSNNIIAVRLEESHYNEIENNDISSVNGVAFSQSNWNNIIGNNIGLTDFLGINIHESIGTNVMDNILENNGVSFWPYFSEHFWYSHNITSSNTVGGKPIYYWKDEHNRTVPSDAGQIFLVNCSEIVVENQELSNCADAITLFSSFNNIIDSNNISKNKRAIQLRDSWDNIISNNEISQNQVSGLNLYYSRGNNIMGNRINDCYLGFYAFKSDDNNIIFNNVSSNRRGGIRIYYSDGNNSVANNTVTSNGLWGIGLGNSQEVEISGNLMTDNGIFIDGNEPKNWDSHEIDTSNMVNGKPVIYIKNQSGLVVPPGAGQIILVNCTDVIVENQNLSNGTCGIEMAYSSNNTIRNNDASSNGYRGIYLQRSKENMIFDNDFSRASMECIYLSSSHNNTITNNTACYSNSSSGIYLYKSQGNNLFVNEASYNNKSGIDIEESKYTEVTNNQIASNMEYGIQIEDSKSISLERNELVNNSIHFRNLYSSNWYTHEINTSNKVNGRPVYYLKNRLGETVPPNAGQIFLINCSGMMVEGQNISNCPIGIILLDSSNNTLNSNTFDSNKQAGIYLGDSSDNLISNNTCSMNQEYGIYLFQSDDNDIMNNILSLNQDGIYLRECDQNHIAENNVSSNTRDGIYLYNARMNDIMDNNIYLNNMAGIHFDISTYNDIAGNTIILNSMYGIRLESSNYNDFDHNYFINNTNQLNLSEGYARRGGSNEWDDGEGEGNYWSDYTGVDTDGDGVGDTELPHQGVDRYPLTSKRGMDEDITSDEPWVGLCIAFIGVSVIIFIALSLIKKKRKIDGDEMDVEDFFLKKI